MTETPLHAAVGSETALRCAMCGYLAPSRNSLAGHLSGHSRRKMNGTDLASSPDRERWLIDAKELARKCLPGADSLIISFVAESLVKQLEKIWVNVR